MNMFAILASVVASIAVGMLWYSPYLFGNTWMKLAGLNPTQKQSMLLPVLSSIFAAFLVSAVLQQAQVNLQQMVVVVIMLWFVFCFALRLPNTLFEKRPLGLFAIYAGHDLVNLLIIAIIVTLWK